MGFLSRSPEQARIRANRLDAEQIGRLIEGGRRRITGHRVEHDLNGNGFGVMALWVYADNPELGQFAGPFVPHGGLRDDLH